MNIFVNGTPHTIIADQLFEHTDGVSVFLGVVDVEKDTFFPFYGVGGAYGPSFIFQCEESMQIVDVADELWETEKPLHAVQTEFNRKKADAPVSVTNERVYERFVKMALIRENRRVCWRGTDEQGTVLKIDGRSLEVLWDAHKGLPQPTLDYELTDDTIQPVVAQFV